MTSNDTLQHSWRWFGDNDPISLEQIRQTGATAIVSALHQVPIGTVWNVEDIRQMRHVIEGAGLRWSVVESVAVHEDIKLRSGKFNHYIENYKQTIRNLGEAGIKTLCYNFMPVLDWSRTDLNYKFKGGYESLLFNYTSFAIIDIYLLQRPEAQKSYPAEIGAHAVEIYNNLDQKERDRLKDTFLLGLPGSGEEFSIEEVRRKIKNYRGIDNEQFKSHLSAFLKEVAPVAEASGVRLAIHPDDPPWPLMGLPKAVSTLRDAEDIIAAYDSPYNGLTFCTGSYGAAASNDLPTMADKLAGRINFAHLRNVSRDDHFNFHEDLFFEGDIDMHSIMQTLVKENLSRYKSDPDFCGIPVRPDHGPRILGDFEMDTYPGYSLYGRMKNLSEIIGLEKGILHQLKRK